jgi:hypothetical protein
MSGCENVLCKRCGYLKCDCQEDRICKQRTEAVIALARELYVCAYAAIGKETRVDISFERAEMFLDAADAYRKQQGE